MDPNFGEIIVPDSRAFWADYDEFHEEDVVRLEPLKWKWMNQGGAKHIPKQLHKFIIIEGNRIMDFVNTSILKNKGPTCQLMGEKISIYDFGNEKGNYTICIAEEQDLFKFAMIANVLRPWLSVANQVTTISIQPNAMHKGTPASDKKMGTFTRVISSVGNKAHVMVQPLESPNFITGVSAAVASLRKIENHPFTCYAVYVDSIELDSVSTEPILRILRSYGINCDAKYVKVVNASSNVYT